MGLILVFRRLVHVQVVLGIIAFGVAEQNPVLVLITGTIGTLAWYIVEGPNGRPLPQWVINLGVVITMLALLRRIVNVGLVLGIGEFILALQLFQLYGHKENRDYALLVVLSLLQVICASMVSVTVVFGALMLIYLVLALFTVLLFQLKLGHDEVREAMARQTPRDRSPAQPKMLFTRGHRTHFHVLAALSGVFCIVLASGFFVAMPRGAGAGMLGDWRAPVRQRVSGFSQQINLGGKSRISESRVPVLNMALRVDGQNIGGSNRSFLLRGMALDRYHRRTNRWQRSAGEGENDPVTPLGPTQTATFVADSYQPALTVTQEITLRSDTQNVLFSVFPPLALSSTHVEAITFNPRDQVIRSGSSTAGSMQYTLAAEYTPRRMQQSLLNAYRSRYRPAFSPTRAEQPPHRRYRYARRPVLDDDRIRRYAQTILDAHDLQRERRTPHTEQDVQICRVIERHLQRNFSYTLEPQRSRTDDDPILAFLFEHQRGHCEVFASAMATLLRSIGIPARVITGFGVSEYNAVGGYYVVRQKHAHAWVEAHIGDTGWLSFDPSPPQSIQRLHEDHDAWWVGLRDFYEYIEFRWINGVITYDSGQRRKIMSMLDQSMNAANTKLLAAWDDARQTIGQWHRRWLPDAADYFLLLLIVAGIALAVWLLMTLGVQHRRRVRKLQVEQTSLLEQRRLVRDCAFYLRTMKLLEKAGYSKPTWQTPGAFAEELARWDGEAMATVKQLTALFYEVRFGGRALDSERARRANALVDRLEQTL